MKKCHTCKQEKSLDQFNKNKTKQDGLNTICRQCSNERSKKYYQENKKKHIDYVAQRKSKHASKRRWLSQFCKDKCCVCGETEKCCLDFHHVDLKEKEFNIAAYVGRINTTDFILEIEKCVVICANCHRKVHANVIQLENIKRIQVDQDIKDQVICRKTYDRAQKIKEKRICPQCNTNEVKRKDSAMCFECRCYSKSIRYNYPDDETLKLLLQEKGISILARNLHISCRALRKHCQKRNLI